MVHNPPVAATLFHLTSNGVHITYDETGTVVLTYQDPTRSSQFAAADIEYAETGAGTMVSVALLRGPEGSSTTFSVLIPATYVHGPGDVSSVNTLGITAVYAPRNPFSTGQNVRYTVIRLHGTGEIPKLSG
jgi:hypothetical protein